MVMLKMISVTWMLSLATICAAQIQAIPTSLHEGRFGLGPRVVDVALSEDGRWLAAAYFVGAMNRPGTDWQAWAAVWDLTTGRRTIVPNAAWPLAFSSDGRWLAMGLYERSEDHRYRMAPRTEPALWKPGEVEPARKLASDVEPGSWLAWTFGDDGKELLAFARDARLLGWEVAGETPGKQIDLVDLPEGVTRGMMGPTRPSISQVDLKAARNELILIASVGQERNNGEPYAVQTTWGKQGSKWIRLIHEVFKKCIPANVALEHRLRLSEHPYVLSLPEELADRYVRPPMGHLSRRIHRLAIDPRQRLIAFQEPAAGLATVRKIDGELVAQLPAATVHAFTTDGTNLITSDCRGVLRFWDVAKGRIVRTLRLDNAPPDTFLVAAVQAASKFGEPQHNRKELAKLIEQAAFQGAQIVVLPETAVTGYMSDDLKQTWRTGDRPVTPGLTGSDPKDAAETVPGESTRFFADVARRSGIYLTVPLLEVDRKTGHYYNTVVLLGPNGQTLIHYRKLNPWLWAEQGWASDGNLSRPVVDTPFGRLGVLVCFDIHKQAAELAKLKIDTLLYSVAWVDDKDSDWFPTRLPTIAAEQGYNVVAANWTVAAARPEPQWHGYGQSTIIAADGRVLANADRINPNPKHNPYRQGVILAELPLPKAEQ
jgi:predicted amidohydrolase